MNAPSTTAEGELERMRAYVYDLILCDLRMPAMDGPTFCRQVQVEHPELVSRIAFLTANATSDEYAPFVRDVGVPLLSKPIAKGDLDELLARMMGPSQPLHVYVEANQLSYQTRIGVESAFGPSGLGHEVLSIDVAEFAQSA